MPHAATNGEILVASSRANPWQNSTGSSRYVPAAYALLQAEFLRRLQEEQRFHAEGRAATVLRQWRYGDWSFHCKGVWAWVSDPMQQGKERSFQWQLRDGVALQGSRLR